MEYTVTGYLGWFKHDYSVSFRRAQCPIFFQTLQLAAVDGGVLELHGRLQRLRVGRQAGGHRRRDISFSAQPSGQFSANKI